MVWYVGSRPRSYRLRGKGAGVYGAVYSIGTEGLKGRCGGKGGDAGGVDSWLEVLCMGGCYSLCYLELLWGSKTVVDYIHSIQFPLRILFYALLLEGAGGWDLEKSVY